MKITEILRRGGNHLSFEVFPPKKESDWEPVKAATEAVAALHPAFVSVTYGAGGGTGRYTLEIAGNIEKTFGLPVVAHLTCVSSGRAFVKERIAAMQAAGIENVMALRGDLTPELSLTDRSTWDYRYAAELVRELKSSGTDFCVGGACYPEVHPESPDRETDLRYLKEKTEAGCDFLTTQMVFDNALFMNFLEAARRSGILVPILPGIMPITSAAQVKRAVQLSGSYIPPRLLEAAERYADRPEEMKRFGIDFAAEQIRALFDSGIRAVHVFTMNKPDVAAALLERTADCLSKTEG